jgi:two-component system, response regulator, stage 0 sporulation protein F
MMTELDAPARHLFGKNTGVAATTPTILVIDDEEGIRALLRMILEGAGYKVLEAANGREGIDLYRRSLSDVIITDIDMPELNGLDMILELTHEFLDAKVIAMSGVGGDNNALDMAKLLGARRIMQKPFSMPRLLDAVRYEMEH